jgi:hypothetical protein
MTLFDIIEKTSRTKKFTRVIVALCSVGDVAITQMQNRICALLVEDKRRYNELVYMLDINQGQVMVASN